MKFPVATCKTIASFVCFFTKVRNLRPMLVEYDFFQLRTLVQQNLNLQWEPVHEISNILLYVRPAKNQISLRYAQSDQSLW